MTEAVGLQTLKYLGLALYRKSLLTPGLENLMIEEA